MDSVDPQNCVNAAVIEVDVFNSKMATIIQKRSRKGIH